MSRPWWSGDVLKRVREQKGLTQGELADKVGVCRVTITRIETGARNPSMPLLQKIANALKVELTDLLK